MGVNWCFYIEKAHWPIGVCVLFLKFQSPILPDRLWIPNCGGIGGGFEEGGSVN